MKKLFWKYFPIWHYSTFRDLILPMLSYNVYFRGRDLRNIFNKESGRMISMAGFYIWMSRICEEDLVIRIDGEDEFGKWRAYRRRIK